MTETTAWTTEEIRSLKQLKGAITRAWTEPGEASPEQRLRELLEAEEARKTPRVLFVQELTSAIDNGQPSDEVTGEESVPSKEEELPVDRIDPNPFQARRRFREEDLLELQASVKENGLLQPVVVRPHPVGSGRYQLVAGERRLRVMRELGWTRAPAIVRSYSNRQLIVLGLVENLQRASLSPAEEARGFKVYLEELKETQTHLAHAIGKTQGHISNRLRLLRLPDPLLELMEDGIFTHSQARDLILPFSQLQEEAWLKLSASIAAALRKTKRALTDEELRESVVEVAVPISRPLSWSSFVWSHDKSGPGHEVLERLEKAHSEKCKCNGPGFSWKRQNSKDVRCFAPEWWDGEVARIQKTLRLRAEKLKAKEAAAQDGEAPDDPLRFEPADRAVPVPVSDLRVAAAEQDVEADFYPLLTYRRYNLNGGEPGFYWEDLSAVDPSGLDSKSLVWVMGNRRYGDGLQLMCLEPARAVEAVDVFAAELESRITAANEARLTEEERGLRASDPSARGTSKELLALTMMNGFELVKGLAKEIGAKPPRGSGEAHEWIETLPDEAATQILWIALSRLRSGDVGKWGADHLRGRVEQEYMEECRLKLLAMVPTPVIPENADGEDEQEED